ncbi:MAG TPA: hypothetical protein VIW68_06520 [Candidatus Sulfotelmatobacter sp.]
MALQVPSGAVVHEVWPTGNTKWWTKLEPTQTLFPTGSPKVGDVAQGQIGNCFLLAAVLAILNQPGGKTYIENMMKEDGAYVIARLYDGDRAVYLRAKKMLCVMKQDSGAAQPTAPGSRLWVSMIEIFCSAFRWAGDPVFDPKNANLARLDSGRTELVLKTLLNCTVKVTRIPDVMEEIEYGGNQYRAAINEPAQLILNNDPAGAAALATLSAKMRNLFTHAGPTLAASWQLFLAGHRGQVIRSKDFEGWVDANVQRQSVRNEMKATFTGVFTGKRGRKDYNLTDQTNFDLIKNAINAHNPTVVNTKKYIARTPGAVGRSAGEQQAKGLVGGHSYAVSSTRDGATGLYLRIINPWGEIVRAYPFNADGSRSAQEALNLAGLQSGEFELLLEDYSKRFEYAIVADLALN